MSQHFKDPKTAQQWDVNPAARNPTRPEQLDLLIALIADAYQPGDTILDLGFGTGLIEAMIFERIPNAQVIGVDASPAMMALADERLNAYSGQYRAIEHDLSALDTLAVEPCRFIISVQALHHLTDGQMQGAYQRIYDLLTPDGMFLLLDRTAAPSAELFPLLQSVWGWQDRRYASEVAAHEGATFEQHSEIVRGRGDLPLTIARHLELMAETGFAATCLNASGLRVLFGAVKRG